MRRLLISILSATTLALVTAAVASAAATFNPFDGRGFIGRGDVITYVGKDALALPRLFVSWGGQRYDTYDCSYSDGSTQRTTTLFYGFWLMFAQPRLNANDVVTGYQTPGQIIDFGFFYQGSPFPCPTTNEAGAILILTQTTLVAYGDWDAHLYVLGIEIPSTTTEGWGRAG